MSGEFDPLSEEPLPFTATLPWVFETTTGDAVLLLLLCGCIAMPWLCSREPLCCPWLLLAGPATCSPHAQHISTPLVFRKGESSVGFPHSPVSSCAKSVSLTAQSLLAPQNRVHGSNQGE